MASSAGRRSKILWTHVLVALWLLHGTFGVFLHYHPGYTHAHAGALEPHRHGGHFHSQEIEQLAEVMHLKHRDLQPGESHHHDDTVPGGDAETIQYQGNKSSLLPAKKPITAPAQPVRFDAPEPEPEIHAGLPEPLSPGKRWTLPASISERAPPAAFA